MQVIENYYSIKDDIRLFKTVEWFEERKIKEPQEHDAFMTMKVFHLFKNEISNNNFKLTKPKKKNKLD